MANSTTFPAAERPHCEGKAARMVPASRGVCHISRLARHGASNSSPPWQEQYHNATQYRNGTIIIQTAKQAPPPRPALQYFTLLCLRVFITIIIIHCFYYCYNDFLVSIMKCHYLQLFTFSYNLVLFLSCSYYSLSFLSFVLFLSSLLSYYFLEAGK